MVSPASVPVPTTKASRPEQPPLVRGSFWMGLLKDFHNDPVDFFSSLVKEHGNLVRFRLGPQRCVLAADPKAIDYVMRANHANYGKDTRGYRALKHLLGTGLLTADGDFWKKQRRIAQPAFHKERLRGFADVMVARGQVSIERLQKLADSGEAFSMSEQMMQLTLEVASLTLLSADVTQDAPAVKHALEVALPHIDSVMENPLPFAIHWPTAANRIYWNEVKVLDDIIYGIIKERKKMIAENAELPRDLLSLFMEMVDEETGDRMNEKQLRDEIMTMFLAGHETTANTLSWGMGVLSQHPDVIAEVRKELQEVLGDDEPNPENIRELPLLNRVIKEILRLYPPAWLVARRTLKDDVITGYAVPKDTVVFCSPFVTQRLESHWENPEAFDPDRFLPEHEAARERNAYFPFATGPRMCIGKGFAEMELRILFAMLLKKFTPHLAEGYEMGWDSAITLRPKEGMRMTLSAASS